jgi:pentapeptide MXKDX repeat protein
MAELNQVYGMQEEDIMQGINVENYGGHNQQNGGAMNGGAMNGGAMNGGAMNGGAMNGGAMNGGAMNGGAMSGGAMNGGAMNGGEGLDDEVDKTINKLKNNIQKQKTLNNLKQQLKKSNDEPSSVVDKYSRSKKDVYKLFVMALLVLLALSMNDTIKYYLGKYIMNNDLTNNNELYLRVSIPLSVLLLIWTLKALTK